MTSRFRTILALVALLSLGLAGCQKKSPATAGDAAFIQGTDGHPTEAQIKDLVPLAIDYVNKLFDDVQAHGALAGVKDLAGCGASAPACAFTQAQIDRVHRDLILAAPLARNALRSEITIAFGSKSDPHPIGADGKPQTDAEAGILDGRITLYTDQIRETSTTDELLSGALLARLAGILVHELEHHFRKLPDHTPRPPEFLNASGVQESFDLARGIMTAYVQKLYRDQAAAQSSTISAGGAAVPAPTASTAALEPRGTFSFSLQGDLLTLVGQGVLMTLPATYAAAADAWDYAVFGGAPGTCAQMLLRYRGPAVPTESPDQNYLMASACAGNGATGGIASGMTNYGLVRVKEGTGNERFQWLVNETAAAPVSASGPQALKFIAKGALVELQVNGTCLYRYDLSKHLSGTALQAALLPGTAGIRGYNFVGPTTSTSFSNFMAGYDAAIDAPASCRFSF